MSRASSTLPELARLARATGTWLLAHALQWLLWLKPWCYHYCLETNWTTWSFGHENDPVCFTHSFFFLHYGCWTQLILHWMEWMEWLCRLPPVSSNKWVKCSIFGWTCCFEQTKSWVIVSCVPFLGRYWHGKHGKVHMYHFPEDPGGMHADSESNFQPRSGNTDPARHSSSSCCQTSKGLSHSCVSSNVHILPRFQE